VQPPPSQDEEILPPPQDVEIQETKRPRLEKPFPTSADLPLGDVAALFGSNNASEAFAAATVSTTTTTTTTATATAATAARSKDEATRNTLHTTTAALPAAAAAANWEDRWSALADYRKHHGHCNVPRIYSENSNLGNWVMTQRMQYKKRSSSLTPLRIQALESLGFEWDYRETAWEDRWSALADYCKIHGHCNVPCKRSENTKLANWVRTQRMQYKKSSSRMTPLRIQALESLGFEWDYRETAWEDRLSELADYRKHHGHCNVPCKRSENTNLGTWVMNQRTQYKKRSSSMTPLRIQALESLGFEWGVCDTAWEDRLSELADYRKIHGHCNVPQLCSENSNLGTWVMNQRTQYRLHLEGKTSSITPSRIQELESLGFEWGVCDTAWEDRLSELADYRKIHGHCNVPQLCSENAQLGTWVMNQRTRYKKRSSSMTPLRIQALESLGFQWDSPQRGSRETAWGDRLGELADYHRIHGHCNVPEICSETSKLATWVGNQRYQYKLHLDGKKSSINRSRIQELESLGFEWKPSVSRKKEAPKKTKLVNDATRGRVDAPEHVQTSAQTQEAFSIRDIGSNEVNVAFEPEEADRNDEVPLGYIPCGTAEI
jgi:hypothetical protein